MRRAARPALTSARHDSARDLLAAELGTSPLRKSVMAFSLTTTYFGHRITIDRFEWGYLAEVVEPDSGRHWVAVNSSALQALENAFEAIDESLKRASAEHAAALGNAPMAGKASTRERADVGP